MAKVLSESARYTSDQAFKEHMCVMRLYSLLIAVASAVLGISIASLLPVPFLLRFAPRSTLPLLALGILIAIVLWGSKEVHQHERKRVAMRRGASGEVQVASILNELPDEYCVIHDLPTGFGNLDHVVVGPAGVFVLDTKNWRGIITSDGSGALLVNGRKPENDSVRALVRRTMETRDKVRVLASGADPYYNVVLVFTAAWVDAKWGSTGKAHCISDEQLLDYILDKKPGERLTAGEIQRIAHAFRSLAQMNETYSPKPFEVKHIRAANKRTTAIPMAGI